MSALEQRFLQIIASLNDAQVRYVIIGGVAMSMHGSAHITQDIDICYSRDHENLTRLTTALAPYHPHLRDFPPDLPFVFDARTLKSITTLTLITDIGAVDLLAEPPGAPLFEELLERSVLMEIQGQQVHACSLDDLIAMKKAANRPKDQLHLMELQALAKIIKEEKAQYLAVTTSKLEG
ncbi:hypothetical protein CCAX7_11500 [Capsulimonas corticalis]|uniref:Uncharacterized protein n=1 Tax=Capsulimonas corticalis TaxID=2219043 RepID=A0A402CUV3_9BACT|nr:DUF6036 family nucleotidyltransferase [Capsulimonas corticalis]BDI29099.1 hypothetical protein CCAX7_11500 [Capsulimonas corticalis]